MKHKYNIENILKLTCVIYGIFLMFSAGTFAYAQTPADNLKGQGNVSSLGSVFKNGIIPCGHKDSTDGTRPDDTCTITDLFSAFARFINFMIASASIFVVYKFVDGSFSLVTANGSQQSISEAKGKMTNAFFGFLLVLLAYLLITTILYFILKLQGPQDILNNPTNYIKAGGQ